MIITYKAKDVIKDLEMRSLFWIILVGLYTNTCILSRERQREFRDRYNQLKWVNNWLLCVIAETVYYYMY